MAKLGDGKLGVDAQGNPLEELDILDDSKNSDGVNLGDSSISSGNSHAFSSDGSPNKLGETGGTKQPGDAQTPIVSIPIPDPHNVDKKSGSQGSRRSSQYSKAKGSQNGSHRGGNQVVNNYQQNNYIVNNNIIIQQNGNEKANGKEKS